MIRRVWYTASRNRHQTPPTAERGALGSPTPTYSPVQTPQFYDDIARYYELIFPDWEVSMSRQGAAIDRLIRRELNAVAHASTIHIVDASAGIGTQALPLARQGFRVTARDISPASIARLEREAAARELHIPAAVADMRTLSASVVGLFDVVLSFDNSMPHLLVDADLLAAFREFFSVLKPGGIVLCSVRDYDHVFRDAPSTHSYGERWRDGVQYRLHQEWAWIDSLHYDATMFIEQRSAGDWLEVVRSSMRYHAISIDRLMAIMQEAGFVDVARDDAALYQPVLIGHRSR